MAGVEQPKGGFTSNMGVSSGRGGLTFSTISPLQESTYVGLDICELKPQILMITDIEL